MGTQFGGERLRDVVELTSLHPYQWELLLEFYKRVWKILSLLWTDPQILRRGKRLFIWIKCCLMHGADDNLVAVTLTCSVSFWIDSAITCAKYFEIFKSPHLSPINVKMQYCKYPKASLFIKYSWSYVRKLISVMKMAWKTAQKGVRNSMTQIWCIFREKFQGKALQH